MSPKPEASKASDVKPKRKDPIQAKVDEAVSMIREHQALSSKARAKALMVALGAADKEYRSILTKVPEVVNACSIIDRAYLCLLKEKERQIAGLQGEISGAKANIAQASEAAEAVSSAKGSLEEALKAAHDRIRQLESENNAMESDLQRAEYAAAAATSECLALQEAAAGIAVADTRRQKMIAVRLAELKEELRRTKHQLRVSRVDGKTMELSVMKLDSQRRALEHEAATLKEGLGAAGGDMELREAGRADRAGTAGPRRNPMLIADPEERLKAIRQPTSYALFDMVPLPAAKDKKKLRKARMEEGGRGGGKGGKENDDDARSTRSTYTAYTGKD